MNGETILYTDPDLWLTEPLPRPLAETEILPVQPRVEPRHRRHRHYLTTDFLLSMVITFGVAFDATLAGLLTRSLVTHHLHH